MLQFQKQLVAGNLRKPTLFDSYVEHYGKSQYVPNIDMRPFLASLGGIPLVEDDEGEGNELDKLEFEEPADGWSEYVEVVTLNAGDESPTGGVSAKSLEPVSNSTPTEEEIQGFIKDAEATLAQADQAEATLDGMGIDPMPEAKQAKPAEQAKPAKQAKPATVKRIEKRQVPEEKVEEMKQWVRDEWKLERKTHPNAKPFPIGILLYGAKLNELSQEQFEEKFNISGEEFNRRHNAMERVQRKEHEKQVEKEHKKQKDEYDRRQREEKKKAEITGAKLRALEKATRDALRKDGFSLDDDEKQTVPAQQDETPTGESASSKPKGKAGEKKSTTPQQTRTKK